MSHDLGYALAFSLPLLATLTLTPGAARLAHRTGLIDRPRQDRLHREPVPYLGGVAVATGVLVAAAILPSGASRQIATVVIGAVAIGALGLWDDWKGLGPRPKLAVETAAAIGLWAAGVRAGFFGIPLLDLPLTVMWVLVVTNAVNVLDNTDGVAPGVAAVSALGLAAIAAGEGSFLVASLALGVAGAGMGFLKHNFPPARIFLGDAGSLMLGFLLASLALKLDLPIWPERMVRAVIPMLALAVPLFDLVLVVLARVRGRRPVYWGGTDHSAHRLLARGYSPRRVALGACATQVICSAMAIVLHRAPDAAVLAGAGTAAAVACAMWGVFLQMEPPGSRGVEDVATDPGPAPRPPS